jgi:hypothetical protein
VLLGLQTIGAGEPGAKSFSVFFFKKRTAFLGYVGRLCGAHCASQVQRTPVLLAHYSGGEQIRAGTA